MTNQPSIYKIGSSKENTFVIDDASVSSFHGEIFKDPENNVFYTDLQTINGSSVNGARIIEPILLRSKDRLIIGRNQLFDWEHLILGKAPIAFKNTSNWKSTGDSNISNLIRENLDLITIYGAVIIMLFFLSFLTS
jgi:pSer/pThr/pTyr-binding forkhead associated (FHA) protein